MAEPTNKSSPKSYGGGGFKTHWTQQSNGNITSTTTSAGPNRTTFTDTFNGVKNPHWKAQIKAVVQAGTAADGLRTTVRSTPLYASASGSTNGKGIPQYQYFRQGLVYSPHVWLSMPAIPGATETSANNQAIAELYSQLTSIERQAQLGEDLGEWKQTRDAIRKPLPQVRSLLDRVTSGHSKALKSRDWRSIPKAMADTYLEWAFGWKPLASSLAQAMVGMQNRDEFAFYYPFSATGQTRSGGVSGNQNVPNVSGQTFWASHLSFTGHASALVRYHGVWGSRVDVPKTPINKVLGLNAGNFLPTVWNLIPYSFLIDYVTNIGDIVEATAVPWSGVRWCMKTVRISKQATYQSVLDPEDPPMGSDPKAKINSYSFSPGRSTISSTSFTRTPVTTLPIPRLEVSFDLSKNQWRNVAALLASRLKPLNLLTQKVLSGRPELKRSINDALYEARVSKSPYPFHK